MQERRRAIRFEIELPLCYQPKCWTKVKAGKIVNISSVGILFTAQDDVPIEMAAEVIVDWPVSRNGEAPIKLFIRGWIVRRQEQAVALEIRRAELRGPGGERIWSNNHPRSDTRYV